MNWPDCCVYGHDIVNQTIKVSHYLLGLDVHFPIPFGAPANLKLFTSCNFSEQQAVLHDSMREFVNEVCHALFSKLGQQHTTPKERRMGTPDQFALTPSPWKSVAEAVCSIMSRLGSGRVKHIEIRFFLVQQLVRSGRQQTARVPKEDNPADFRTKSLPKAKLQVLLPRAGLLVDTGASVDHVRSVCPPPSTGPLKLQIMALIALLQSALTSSAVPGDETSFVANFSFGLDAQAISYIMFCWVVLQIIGLAIGLCIYMKPGWGNRSSPDLRNIGIQTVTHGVVTDGVQTVTDGVHPPTGDDRQTEPEPPSSSSSTEVWICGGGRSYHENRNCRHLKGAYGIVPKSRCRTCARG